jgi:segregation and condensation protein B
MAVTYASGDRGIVLEEIAGGYQLRTPKEHALYVRRLLAAKPPRLSRPLLETLSIIAYRQPVTRPEIEQLRGVDSGGVLDTLVERSLIKIAGRKEAPGRPMMYATTVEFLELFGLKDLENLPDLAEFRALEDEPAESSTDQELSGESMPVSEEAEAIAATSSERVEEQPGETQEQTVESGDPKKSSDDPD